MNEDDEVGQSVSLYDSEEQTFWFVTKDKMS